MNETVRTSLLSLAAVAMAAAGVLGCTTQPSARQQPAPADVTIGAGGARAPHPGPAGAQPRPASGGFVECGATRCDVRAAACVHFGGKPPGCVSKAERDGYARGLAMVLVGMLTGCQSKARPRRPG